MTPSHRSFSLESHIDIIEDFDEDLIARLVSLSEAHDFLIFEDRKFADIGMPLCCRAIVTFTLLTRRLVSIGNTVVLQYSKGVHKIASWSHITNAHPVPGPSIIKGLSSVGLPLGRGLLLLAEMSSAGNLASGEYTAKALQMARDNREFVIGFIAMRKLGVETATADEDFLVLTPGVSLESKGDGMGQQYRSPRQVILESGCDVIIVGRGIYGAGNGVESDAVREAAERYRSAGWTAYEERIRGAS